MPKKSPEPEISQENLQNVIGVVINYLKYVIEMLEELREGKDVSIVQ